MKQEKLFLSWLAQERADLNRLAGKIYVKMDNGQAGAPSDEDGVAVEFYVKRPCPGATPEAFSTDPLATNEEFEKAKEAFRDLGTKHGTQTRVFQIGTTTYQKMDVCALVINTKIRDLVFASGQGAQAAPSLKP